MARYPLLPPMAEKRDVINIVSFWGGTSVKGFTNAFGVSTQFIDPLNPDSDLTVYGYRVPCGSSGTDVSPYLLLTGDPAAEQSRFDDMLRSRALAGTDLGILWYPPASQVGVGPVPDESLIMQAVRDRYFASRYRTAVKLVYIIQAFWWKWPGAGENVTSFLAGLVADILAGSYRLVSQGGIDQRPVIGIYSTPSNDWDAALIAGITAAVTGAGLGTPIYVQMTMDVTQSNSLGLNYITGYGPNGNSAGPGHQSYATQMSVCVAHDSVAGANASRCLNVVHNNDDRPRGLPDTDNPLYTQWEQFNRDRSALARSGRRFDPARLVHTYSGQEDDEGGDFDPTAQTILRGPNVPSLGVYFDALVNVRNDTFPEHPIDSYHARSVHADWSAVPAGWALTQGLSSAFGGQSGEYQYSSMQNSTNVLSRTLTTSGRHFWIRGGRRPGLGIIRFVFDGGAPVDVDQSTIMGTGYNQVLFDSGPVSPGVHTVTISRVSGLADYAEALVER